MIDINSLINREISKEIMIERYNLSKEIIEIIGCPKSPSEYIDRVQMANERLFQIQEEYHKFLMGE